MEGTRRRAVAETGEELTEESPAIEGLRLEEQTTQAVTAYVGLGSNVGDRLSALRDAVSRLSAGEGVRVVSVSPVYEAEAHVQPGQAPGPAFLNAVVALSTALNPLALLDRLLAVERAGGRRRDGRRWEARTLDLDLLLFGDHRISEHGLMVPHPRLRERRFVLAPLADLAPALIVPGTGLTVEELLAKCVDPHPVTRTELELR